jgi:hypothetical protein
VNKKYADTLSTSLVFCLASANAAYVDLEPPVVLEGWLKPGWQLVDGNAEVLPIRNFPDFEKGRVTIDFTADPERVASFDQWMAERAKWSEAERPAVAARKVFARLHALWTTLQREGDRLEVILADGLLDVPSHAIRHHVLLQRVGLEFDSTVPEFRFIAGIDKIDLHRALLRLVPGVEGRMIAAADKELEKQQVEPLGNDSTAGFLRGLIQSVFIEGEFSEMEPADREDERPRIWREPVLFVRPRNAGLSSTLDFIIEDLAHEQTITPDGLSRIVGVEAGNAAVESPVEADETLRRAVAADADILFSKPANAEQFHIAERLDAKYA